MLGRIVCRTLLVACLARALVAPPAAGAQTGGFLVTLGVDTIAVEKWSRSANKVEGTTVTHLPFGRVTTWTLTLNGDGTVASYDQSLARADGAPMPNTPTVAKMTFTGDSVIRDVTLNGNATSRRNAVPKGTVPAIVGSWYHFQLGVQQAKRDGSGAANVIGFGAQQNSVQKVAVTLIGQRRGR